MKNEPYILVKTAMLIILITAIVFSCNNGNKDSKISSGIVRNDKLNKEKSEKIDKSENIEDKIIDKILDLPEIKERTAYIIKETGGQRNLKIWIVSTPDKNNNFYVVKAAEDNGMSYVTHFEFHVYPKTMEIKYYDVLSDSELSLAEWRKGL